MGRRSQTAHQWIFTIGKAIVFITFAIVVTAISYRYSLDLKIEGVVDDSKTVTLGEGEEDLMNVIKMYEEWCGVKVVGTVSK